MFWIYVLIVIGLLSGIYLFVDKEKAVDYDGWNIPGVKFWMPCPEIPKND